MSFSADETMASCSGPELALLDSFQMVEVFWQLQGKWDKFHAEPERWTRYGKKKPDDWKSLQIDDAKRGLAISHAGVGSHVVCSVLEKA